MNIKNNIANSVSGIPTSLGPSRRSYNNIVQIEVLV